MPMQVHATALLTSRMGEAFRIDLSLGVCRIAVCTVHGGTGAHLSRKWSPTLGRQAKCQGRAFKSRPALRTWMLLPTWSYLRDVLPLHQLAVHPTC